MTMDMTMKRKMKMIDLKKFESYPPGPWTDLIAECKMLQETNEWLRQLLRCAKTFTVSGNPHEFNDKCDCVFLRLVQACS